MKINKGHSLVNCWKESLDDEDVKCCGRGGAHKNNVSRHDQGCLKLILKDFEKSTLFVENCLLRTLRDLKKQPFYSVFLVMPA